MKICSTCKLSLDESNFYQGQSKCKKCHLEYARAYKKAHPDKVKEQRKRYNTLHKDLILERYGSLEYRFLNWKGGAQRRNILWNLEFKDLEAIPRICFYTGKPLSLDFNQENTISLDRVDSSKGYTKDNVVFCCADINRMKQEFSIDKFLNLCQSVC